MDKFDLKVLKALNKAFQIADNRTNQNIDTIEIPIKYLKELLIEKKIKDNPTLTKQIKKSLNNLGFSDTGNIRSISRSYLKEVLLESNHKL
jgi:hypothetical protein